MSQGTLEVRVVEGRQLKDTDVFGRMDPYVVARAGLETKKTTAINNGGRNPVINQTLLLNIIPGMDIVRQLVRDS